MSVSDNTGQRYALDNDHPRAGQHHALLAALFDGVSTERVERLLDLPGKRCLEVGAGGGTFAAWLAGQVGRQGHVLATDIKPHTITARHPRLTVIEHDLSTDPVPGGGWDFIHARLVLAHLPEREEILARLVAALAGGGVLLVEDFDTRSDMVLHGLDQDAASLYAAFQRTLSLKVFAAAGTDRTWARRAHGAVLDAGLVEVQTTGAWESWTGGSPGARFIAGMIDQARDRLLAAGLTDAHLDRVGALLADPHLVLAGHTLVSTSGHKPPEDQVRHGGPDILTSDDHHRSIEEEHVAARHDEGTPAPGGSLPSRLDSTKPHSARVWNYWLGGKDNFAADRQLGEQIRDVYPQIVEVARVSRAFLGRAVRFLAGAAGIRQFLDIGTGLPTADNTHEVAQRVDPACRVVYVDNDPLVLVHARALLTSRPEGTCDYVDADVRDPDTILRQAARTLDFTEPVAVTMLGILGNVVDYEQARTIVRRLVDAMAPGSYLVVNDGTNVIHGQARDEVTQISIDAGTPYIARSPAQVARFFDGLHLLEPGVVCTSRWRPDPASGALPSEVDVFCGVARKP
jgi:ubiquinone/menaquinone biosynthesis C-methylase UbiE